MPNFFYRDRLPLGLGEVLPVIVFPLPKDMAAIREQGFLGKVQRLNVLLALKWSFIGQPDNHIG